MLLKKIKDNVVAVFSVIGAVLLFALGLVFYIRSKESKALEAQLNLAKTQKEVDIIESQINQHKETIQNNKKELDELAQVEVQLKNKREELAKQESGKSAEEIEEYWKKN